MCLLALLFRVVDDAPLVIGANREEAYARGGEPPQLLGGAARAVGGRDPEAGGTWLGVNAHGLVVAVTNRRGTRAPAQPRSRGLLVRDLLDCPSAATAVEQATRELSLDRYSACNLVCADAERLVVLMAGDLLRVAMLPPGIHVLANRDVNDAGDERVLYARWWLHQPAYANADDCLEALRQLCSLGSNGQPPICLRGADRGTVSSSLLALRSPPAPSTYLHAQGPPGEVSYEDCSHLLAGFETAAES
jgi:uncharacterized protein with NRDE domain